MTTHLSPLDRKHESCLTIEYTSAGAIPGTSAEENPRFRARVLRCRAHSDFPLRVFRRSVDED